MSAMLALIAVGVMFFIVLECTRVARSIAVAKQLGREATPVSRAGSGAQKKFLIIGDSTSYGTGASDPRTSLAGRLADEFPTSAIDNLSENAMSLERLSRKMQEVGGGYDVMLIHIGGVDTLSFTPLATVRRRLVAILASAKAKAKRVVVVSVNNPGSVPAFRPPLAELLSWRSRRVSRAFAEVCAQEQVTHVPLWRERGADPLAHEPRRLIARDGMHPNDEGYAIWYGWIRTAL